jgi:hypothetical protein
VAVPVRETAPPLRKMLPLVAFALTRAMSSPAFTVTPLRPEMLPVLVTLPRLENRSIESAEISAVWMLFLASRKTSSPAFSVPVLTIPPLSALRRMSSATSAWRR